MTSRERVDRALNRQPIDRIPNGLGGCDTAGMHVLAYDLLKEVMGVQSQKNRMSTFLSTAIFEPEVLHAIGGDMIQLASRHCPVPFWGPGSAEVWKDQTLWEGKTFQVPVQWNFHRQPDGSMLWADTRMVCPRGAYYFDSVPAADGALLGDSSITPDDYNPPHGFPEEQLRALEESARWLYEHTDYAIVLGEMVLNYQLMYELPGGFMGWWMLLASEPQTAHEILNKACEAAISQIRQLDQAIGKYTAMALLCDDMGDISGVTVGQDLWREIFKPHYAMLFQEWHRSTNMKICLHSCGSVRDILGDLIECGVDVLNPVQISARDMDPMELKKLYGDRVIFYGGAYDAVLCPVNLPEEAVYEAVKRNIAALSQGGGYLFAGVHNIPGDVPEAHIGAIIRAYLDACTHI